MDTQNESKSKFDPVKVITQAFGYLRHVRLMILMLAVGLVAGVVGYLYTMPTYQAKSPVYFQVYGTAIRNNEVPETLETQGRIARSLLTRFRAERIQIGAARRLGLIGKSGTYEDVLEHIPAVRVGLLDHHHMEVMVLAYDPEIVKEFCQAMIDEFRAFQESSWSEFRDEALERYEVELAELERKVSESMDSLSELDRDQHLTEITIEQQSLLEIPKKLIITRERLIRMGGIRKNMQEFGLDSTNSLLSQGPSAPDSSKILSLLSLLSSFEKETVVEVGDVVKKNLSGTSGTVVASRGRSQQVVLPSNVDGLEPWRELEKQKRILEAEIAMASEKYLPEHPVMKDLAGRLGDANRGLFTEMQVLRDKFNLEYESLKANVVTLEARMPEYYKVTKELGKTTLTYNTMEQTQKMWNKAREDLAEKLAAITHSEKNDWIQMRFKGHTSIRGKGNPVSPNKMKLVMLSLLIGVAGAFGLPTVLNLFNTSASTIQQLEEYTGLKGIGIVPLCDQTDLESIHRSPAQGATIPNYLLECFRLIRANICLHPGRDDRSQVILVTSARPQEGKTTQSANLAWAFHSMGERVLLVDCDLRRGRVHDLIGIDKSPGNTMMLMGDVSPAEAIVTTRLKGFHVLPRGPVVAGTTELLCQNGFETLINEWRKHYDRIILDCPPTLGLSESSSLQRLADGVVMVVRSEKTPVKDVLDAVTLLRKTNAHFFGFVLNSVDLSKAGNYYNYYYYSATYYDQFEEDDQDEFGKDFISTV